MNAAPYGVLIAAGGGAAASAQIQPLVSTVPPPPVPAGPLSQSLSGAYRAIVSAAATDPTAAQRASFLYAQARERAGRGDVSGALAASAAARAAALSPSAPAGIPALAPSLPGAVYHVPVVESAALLPAGLLVARNEIELAERTHAAGSLDEAKRRYRNALNAYLSGNAAKAAAEARASFDLSSAAFAKVK